MRSIPNERETRPAHLPPAAPALVIDLPGCPAPETAECGTCGAEMLTADHDAWSGRCFGCKLAGEVQAELATVIALPGTWEAGYAAALRWMLAKLVRKARPL